MRIRTLLLPLFLGITLLAVAAYDLLPSKRYGVLPTRDVQLQLLQAYTPNEVTISHWTDWDNAHFSCKDTTTGEQYGVCALTLFFGEDYTKGIDLSAFDALVIEADYFGDVAKLRVFVRNFNPEYSNVDDDNSAKYMSLTMASRELAVPKPIKISLQEFTVADWWFDQHDVTREHRPLEFGNITLLRFDFSEYISSDQYLDLRLNNLYFEGPFISKQSWYLAIILCWVLVGLCYGLLKVLAYARRNQMYRKRINELASDRAHLSSESQKYQALSHLDPLTKVFNRLGLEKQITYISNHYKLRPTALVVIDIDHFKNINDTYGHAVGDEILCSVTTLINNKIRQDDVLARWGGEEFVLISPGTNLDTAFKLAEKLRLEISNHLFVPTNPIKITCSFGVTVISANEPFEDAFKRADGALYQAKNQGRNCTALGEV